HRRSVRPNAITIRPPSLISPSTQPPPTRSSTLSAGSPSASPTGPTVRNGMTPASSAASANSTELAGASVIVAGAGLAGLTAAYELMSMGADVTVVDARERVGGRVWTIRDGFVNRQHAEAGGDMIDKEQHAIRQLIASLGLKLMRILRGGFGYIRPDAQGRPRLVKRASGRGWDRLSSALEPLIRRCK